jgi:hypothetical protein
MGKRGGRRGRTRGQRLDVDARSAPVEVDGRLRVDLDARVGLSEQRDLDRDVAAAGDRRDDRLGRQAALVAQRALVRVEQVGVALGTQRPRTDEDRVDRRAQLAQERLVSRVPEPGRAARDGRAPVGRHDHRGDHARPRPALLAEPERRDDVARGPARADGAEGLEGVAHPGQHARAQRILMRLRTIVTLLARSRAVTRIV